MHERGFWRLESLADAELESGLHDLVARGRAVDARVVAHLAEVEARRLHLRNGAPSLFVYCQKQLHLSENQAFYRITAARVGRQFPAMFGMLARGELSLSTVALLSKHLTLANHELLFVQSRGKTKLQVLELLTQHAPRPDVESTIRKLLPRSGMRSVMAGPTGTLEPLSQVSYRLQLNVGPCLKHKLELARDLMSHANTSGDLAVVVEAALDVLIPKLQGRRFGQLAGRNSSATEEPQESSPQRRSLERMKHPNLNDEAGPLAICGLARDQPFQDTTGAQRRRRAIPREIRRKLIERDGACCSFVGEKGERCEARALLQIHHVQAWAKGGADTLDNLRLLCAAHNRLLGDEEFGRHRRAS